ncbi:MAG: hypothetical protein HY876_09255 [Coriobacteriales bacterium]|nr:hypothetical protein [Coriobacteriales bacterium]
MGVLSSAYVRAANDVVHDVAASVAMAFPLASLVVRRAASAADSVTLQLAYSRIAWSLIGAAILALVVIVATGGVRLQYASLGIRPKYVSLRARAALIKHAVFVSVAAVGFASALLV